MDGWMDIYMYVCMQVILYMLFNWIILQCLPTENWPLSELRQAAILSSPFCTLCTV